MPAYLEFPPDLFGQNLRKHGFVLVHIAVVCYMFYCLAVVCDNYFLPALEECAEVRTFIRSFFRTFLKAPILHIFHFTRQLFPHELFDE